jgi:hypothetical protein
MDIPKYKSESQTMIKKIRDMINGDMPIIAIEGNEEHEDKSILFDHVIKAPIDHDFIKKVLFKFIEP